MKCRFCYYQDSMKECRNKDLTTEAAKKWIGFFYKKGKRAIDLTGGEPTIRKDIIELVDFCKQTGYEYICVITNGIRMADNNFCQALVAAGLNDVLFSLHGPDAVRHDSLTCTPGSFQKLITAMDNMRLLGVRLRSNTVVNGLSFKHVKAIGRILKEKGVEAVNFILFNPIVEAQSSESDMNVTYEEASGYLKELIDIYRNDFKKITIRYMPFCFMPGYESYITNTPQIQYDPDEWDYYLRTYFRNGFYIWFIALCLGFLLHPAPQRFLQLDWAKSRREAIKWALAFKNKIKGKVCAKCAYFQICDGLWRDYAKKKGFGSLRPVSGKKISDPVFFMASQR